jgi:hypothetical protein
LTPPSSGRPPILSPCGGLGAGRPFRLPRSCLLMQLAADR